MECTINLPGCNSGARRPEGTVLLGETYVRVKWPSLTFIAVLLVSTTVSSLAVVEIGHTGRTTGLTDGWKSSLLLLAFCVLETTPEESRNCDGETDPWNMLGGNVNDGSQNRRMEKAAHGNHDQDSSFSARSEHSGVKASVGCDLSPRRNGAY